MLYGDWGTSKAYVIGIAFAIAGHGSFMLLCMMAVLMFMVGLAYTIICKVNPYGGGVYSSVRERSPIIAVIGALLLIADYVITASLSSVVAFQYLGFNRPELWAMATIFALGVINYFGPTKGANLATGIAVAAGVVLAALAVACIPHLGNTVISFPSGGAMTTWTSFVGIVLAISGVEAIANTTGIMKLPVEKTAKKAIWPVMVEVVVITLILGAAVNAIPNLSTTEHTEDMLKVVASFFVAPWFGTVVSIALALLLISATNTAMQGLVSLQFIMGKDRELPRVFARLNRYGMPWFSLLVAIFIPILILMIEHDLAHLAALYAIGAVGAITIDTGACFSNKKIEISKAERALLGLVCVVLAFIWITIAFEKHNALIYASLVLAIGLTARMAGQWVKEQKAEVETGAENVLTLTEAKNLQTLYAGGTLVALREFNENILKEAALRAKGRKDNAVYIIFIEQVPPGWGYPLEAEPSRHASRVLGKAVQAMEKQGLTGVPIWRMGSKPAHVIAETVRELELDSLFIGTTRRGALERFLKGQVLVNLAKELPTTCQLHICN